MNSKQVCPGFLGLIKGEDMIDEEVLPKDAYELVKYLDHLFPDKIVTAEQSPYEQGKLHGIIELIRRLKYVYTEEKDE